MLKVELNGCGFFFGGGGGAGWDWRKKMHCEIQNLKLFQ